MIFLTTWSFSLLFKTLVLGNVQLVPCEVLNLGDIESWNRGGLIDFPNSVCHCTGASVSVFPGFGCVDGPSQRADIAQGKPYLRDQYKVVGPQPHVGGLSVAKIEKKCKRSKSDTSRGT